MTDAPPPPPSPEIDPLELTARDLHAQRCAAEPWLLLPAWDDLDLSDPWEGGARDLAFDRARGVVVMRGQDGDEG